LQLSGDSLTFAGMAGVGNPATQTVTIANTGGGTLNWTAGKTQAWLVRFDSASVAGTKVTSF
jgi:hypothetical protein